MSQNVTLKLIKSDDWRQKYATTVIGGHTSYDFRISFINEIGEFHENGNLNEIDRVINTEIVMPPRAAKELLNWLADHIKIYEQSFGEINIGVPGQLKQNGNTERKPLNYTSEVG